MTVAEVAVGGRRLRVTNLDKVLWPEAGLTKGWMLDWYRRVAGALLPHVRGHPLTLHRFPDGVHRTHWYETRAPAHPDWVRTVTFEMPRTGKVFDVVVVDDEASLLWAAQAGSVELHPFLGCAEALDRPRWLVFDLDPGPPAGLIDCCRVALDVRALLADVGLDAVVKTSGVKGLHVVVPLSGADGYGATKAFARAVAELLTQQRPDAVVAKMAKSARPGRVFVDWSQNDPGKSTVAPYSLRGLPLPTVSTPVTWDEVAAVAGGGDVAALRFGPDDVLGRLDASRDLWSSVPPQSLPALGDR
jgi:bifunctional non-homologous end joining protein LigD